MRCFKSRRGFARLKGDRGAIKIEVFNPS